MEDTIDGVTGSNDEPTAQSETPDDEQTEDEGVEVDAGPDATYIECSIAVNGNVVSTHRSEGGTATAVCERGLRLGPS